MRQWEQRGGSSGGSSAVGAAAEVGAEAGCTGGRNNASCFCFFQLSSVHPSSAPGASCPRAIRSGTRCCYNHSSSHCIAVIDRLQISTTHRWPFSETGKTLVRHGCRCSGCRCSCCMSSRETNSTATRGVSTTI